MKSCRSTSALYSLREIAVLLFIGMTLIACTQQPQQASTSDSATNAPSTTTLDSFDATKQASDARYNEYAAGIRTAAANNPTNIPGPPPTDTPGTPPTSTPVLGIQPCPAPAHPQFYSFKDCWGGIAGGQVVYAAAGGETSQISGGGKSGNAAGRLGDPTQGVIELYLSNDQTILYNTPIKIGKVGILAANGTQLTLAPVNPNDRRYLLNSPTIVFDISTRQFISASGTPISTTPVPTSAP